MRPLRRGLLVFLAFTLSSCHNPPKPDGEVRVTTARELVKQYRDDPTAARSYFTGQLVRVRVTGVFLDDHEVHWKFAGGEPPAIVFRFDSTPALSLPCSIEGICEGRVEDGKKRDIPGCTFSVAVTGCRVVPESP